MARSVEILQAILDRRMHPNHTDLTLEAHYRAVHRGIWPAPAKDADLVFLRQCHPAHPAIGAGDGKCRENDGRIPTCDGWQELMRWQFKRADALDQFGGHYGCRAFWFPIPADTLAQIAIDGRMAMERAPEG